MMAACPNCRSQINHEQMFCRACGFRLENNFQISTHKLGLPSTAPLQLSARPTAGSGASQSCSWRNNLLPIAGFILALFIGGFTTAMLQEKPINNFVPTDSVSSLSERSYMGVYLVGGYSNTNGAIIDRLVEDSPAEKAGLRSGDRIIAINETEMFSTNEVVTRLSETSPNSSIEVKVLRNGEVLYIPITTVRHSELNLQAFCRHEGFLGVGDLTPGYVLNSDDTGVEVGMIVADSAAERLGLQQGDVISTINNVLIDSPESLSRTVRSISPGEEFEIIVSRNDELISLTGSMGSRR